MCGKPVASNTFIRGGKVPQVSIYAVTSVPALSVATDFTGSHRKRYAFKTVPAGGPGESPEPIGAAGALFCEKFARGDASW